MSSAILRHKTHESALAKSNKRLNLPLSGPGLRNLGCGSALGLSQLSRKVNAEVACSIHGLPIGSLVCAGTWTLVCWPDPGLWSVGRTLDFWSVDSSLLWALLKQYRLLDNAMAPTGVIRLAV